MTTLSSARIQTLDIVYIALFSIVLAICSWISIPTFIPFTMQTFGVFFILCFMGGKRGFLVIVTYLLLGIIGLPVFAGFTSGIGCILGCTGGYLVGFLFSALITWALESCMGKTDLTSILSIAFGLLACYTFGTLWFMFVYSNSVGDVGLFTTLGWCVFPYLIPDIVKVVLAFTLSKKLRKIIRIDGGNRA